MTSAIPGFRRMADSARPPFGTATLPGLDAGADLTGRDYVEEEFLAEGDASAWAITERPGEPTPLGDPRRFVTRVLVRRPRDPERASGTVHLEPLHPMQEEALTWSAAGAAFTRAGDAWVGVSVYAHMAEFLRDVVDPERYAALDIPAPGLEWDILGGVARALRAGAVPGLRVSRTILSGWSATGTFTRLFVREGFARRHPGAIDGAVVVISSGGAGDAGYPALSPGSAAPAPDDPRRTIRDAGIPVFEVLSECESETHEHQTRDDSDEPGDPYRLYQVAGTGHIESWARGRLANSTQLAALGRQLPGTPILERLSDGRLDLVVRALLTRMDDWIAGRGIPPHAPRLSHDGPARDNGRDLLRDADGNAVGGIRTPWIEAPLGRYHPHATVAPDAPPMPEWVPFRDPALAAWLRAIVDPFPAERVLARFGSEDGYLAQFTAATRALEDAGLLLEPDARELLDSAPARWAAATGT